MSGMYYLDCNATAPLSARARRVWLEAQDQFIGNPASNHRLGQRADNAIEQARQSMIEWLGGGATMEDLIWTSGATEGANAVLAHLARHSSEAAEVWVSAVEHPCVLAAAERWFPERVVRMPVREDGVLDVVQLETRLRGGRPAVVCVQAANNESGVLQPWNRVQELCEARQVPVLCDATQWVGRVGSRGLGKCDFLIGSAHKCGGPVGTGFLKTAKTGPSFSAFLVGGEQEAGRRAGTQNVAGVLSMVEAFREAEERQSEVCERVEWRGRVEQEICKRVLGARIVGATAERLWNTVCVTLPELSDCRMRWVVRLDAAGIVGSTGSACASGKEEPSHVLRAMGLSPEAAGRTIRLSSGWETSEEVWDHAVEALGEIHRKFGVKAG